MSNPSFNFRWIVLGAAAIIAAAAMLSCFATIPADSEGVLIRLGKFHSILKPGLQFKLPLGIDRLEIIPTQRQQKLEFGYSTPGATNPDQVSEDPEAEKSMVTGDLNMVLVEWTVQYRIDDPRAYLFNVRDPDSTLRDASESATREVVGDRTVDEVLTVGRQEVEMESLNRLRELAQRYGLGVSVMQVQLKNVNPPRPVQASFNEVNQAQQERERAINVANGEYNKVVPRASGEADQQIAEAEGYALQRVGEARGNAERFRAEFGAYQKAPEVTRQRLYLETIADIFPLLERKVILDEKASRILPLLPLDSGTPSRSTAPAAAAATLAR
ncbi:MAG: FtsH protease activity modulator HflK [Chthoniobacteraceae bacterium]